MSVFICRGTYFLRVIYYVMCLVHTVSFKFDILIFDYEKLPKLAGFVVLQSAECLILHIILYLYVYNHAYISNAWNIIGNIYNELIM